MTTGFLWLWWPWKALRRWVSPTGVPGNYVSHTGKSYSKGLKAQKAAERQGNGGPSWHNMGPQDPTLVLLPTDIWLLLFFLTNVHTLIKKKNVAVCGILVPQPRLNQGPLHWKRAVPTTGLPGKSHQTSVLIAWFHCLPSTSDLYSEERMIISNINWAVNMCRALYQALYIYQVILSSRCLYGVVIVLIIIEKTEVQRS